MNIGEKYADSPDGSTQYVPFEDFRREFQGANGSPFPTIPKFLSKKAGKKTNDKPSSSLILFLNIAILIAFIGLLTLSPFYDGMPCHAQRCLAVLILISGWWGLGTFPLYVTALAVPMLAVICDTIPGMETKDAAELMISSMWGGSQVMVLGSFAMAAALSKVELDKEFACGLLALVKHGKKRTLFALMFLGWVASALVGNVAASVLCMSMAQPILDQLPEEAEETPKYARRLLIGIAFACNVGGMTSPIASPQNVVAYTVIKQNFGTVVRIGFLSWIGIALPISFILLILTFLALHPYAFWRSLKGSRLARKQSKEVERDSDLGFKDIADSEKELAPELTADEPLTWDLQRVAVLAVCTITIGTWLGGSRFVDPIFGDIGLASLFPLICLFGMPGVLSKGDLLSLPWDVCLLMSGGSALGVSVRNSELLLVMGQSASDCLEGWSPLACEFFMCAFVTVVSTFVSHTAAANVLMPFICELGIQTCGPRQGIRLAITSSFCLSAGCALPVSSCPNINATSISKYGDSARPWLLSTDFVKPGVVVSIFCLAVIPFLGDYLAGVFCLPTA